jgi:hypothetical protein
MESVVCNFADEDQMITIHDPNSGKQVTVPTLLDKLNPGFLLPAERDLLHYFMMIHNNRFTWETSE